MATVAVLADPPVEGFVLPEMVAQTPLSEGEATQLYSAMLVDVCRAIQHGSADLLVNFRDPEQVPGDVDSEQRLRELLEGHLEAPGEARYEVQVGETFAGRVGNTVTHLLEQEGEDSAGVLEPTAAFIGREQIGNAAMKLRSSELVLGPARQGRVYFAGFTEPIDFEDAFAPPAVGTLTDRGDADDLDVDFLPMLPILETGADLADALVQLRARQQAGRRVPAATAAVIDDMELTLETEDDGLAVARRSDSS